MKNRRYHTARTGVKYSRKIEETGAKSIPSNRLGTDGSIKIYSYPFNVQKSDYNNNGLYYRDIYLLLGYRVCHIFYNLIFTYLFVHGNNFGH